MAKVNSLFKFYSRNNEFLYIKKVNWKVVQAIYKDPLRISVTIDYPGPSAEILVFNYQSINIYYYNYNIGGFNIILLNILFSYFLK